MGNEFSTENIEDEIQDFISIAEQSLTEIMSDGGIRQTLDNIINTVYDTRNVQNVMNDSEDVQDAVHNFGSVQNIVHDPGDVQNVVSELFSEVSGEIRAIIHVQPFIHRVNEQFNREDFSLEEKKESILLFIETDTTGIENLFPGSEQIENMKKFYIFYLYSCIELLETKDEEDRTALTPEETSKILVITQMYSQLNFLEQKLQLFI